MFGTDKNVKSGESQGRTYLLQKRSIDMVISGAAPYVLYVNGEFYCTCENLAQADEEIAAL